MRNRHEPPADPAAWEFHQAQSTADPHRNSPAVTRPVPVTAEEQPGATRSAGLRRLSRLTWRATQLPLIERRGACRHPDGATQLVRSLLRAFPADARWHERSGSCAGVGRPPLLPLPRDEEREWEFR